MPNRVSYKGANFRVPFAIPLNKKREGRYGWSASLLQAGIAHRGEEQRKRPGPARRPSAEEVVEAVVEMATANPWYGYKQLAVMCRRAGQQVKDRETYMVMKDHGSLQKRKTRRAEAYQVAKLFELLQQGPNDLWQMDVTYVHIPGYGNRPVVLGPCFWQLPSKDAKPTKVVELGNLGPERVQVTI